VYPIVLVKAHVLDVISITVEVMRHE
jgi:hypothetical protein